MKIWTLRDPWDRRYAELGLLGTWTPTGSGGVCPGCTAALEVRSRPLLGVWLAGSTEIGDFSWPGSGGSVVVTDSVMEVLHQFQGVEVGPVEIVADPVPTRRGLSVPLPYQGPGLQELWVTAEVGVDRERSSVEREYACQVCGAERWALYGVERWDSRVDLDSMQLERTRVDRLPNAGIYVDRADVNGADIFRVAEFPGRVLCSDRVRRAVLDRGFTNVSFMDTGTML
jgi:hypothetical protein